MTEGVKSVMVSKVVVVIVVRSPEISPAIRRIDTHNMKNHVPAGAKALNLQQFKRLTRFL